MQNIKHMIVLLATIFVVIGIAKSQMPSGMPSPPPGMPSPPSGMPMPPNMLNRVARQAPEDPTRVVRQAKELLGNQFMKFGEDGVENYVMRQRRHVLPLRAFENLRERRSARGTGSLPTKNG